MMFLRHDSGPFYMPTNERLKLQEDNLEKYKFATIQKNKLLKEIFAVENWTDKEVIIVCGKMFIVNTAKIVWRLKILRTNLSRRQCYMNC